MNPASSRRTYAALPAVWGAVVLVLTLLPSDRLPETPVWEFLSFDTAAHAGVFAVLAGLSWFSLRRQAQWPRLARRPGWPLLLACVLFGALIEVLQTAMHLGRHGEWTDLVGDAFGAATALGLLSATAAPLQRRGWLLAGGLALWGANAHPSQAQDLARAHRTIETLAARPMHGRGYVQHGERRAAAYLRERLRRLGLQPLAPNYTQPFTLDVNTFPGQLELAVGTIPGFRPRPANLLKPGSAYIADAASASADFRGGVVQLDTLIFQDTARARLYLLPKADDERARPCNNCPLLLRQRDQSRLASLPAATQARVAAQHQLVLVPKLTATLAPQQSPAAKLEILATSWPKTSSNYWAAAKITAELKRNYPTQNLCAVVRGSAQPDSFLVVSAHYDHLGTMGARAYFPGANDNASGVAMLLELAAHYARPENRPACSVAFLLFGAEEAGLVGSRYFVAHPLVPLRQIKFLVNLDLLGTGEAGATVVNGRVHEAAFRQLTRLNDVGHYLPSLGARGRAANSDHFPFSEAGVPAFFLYTRGGSPAYHDVDDTPDRLSLAGFAGAFGLVRDFLDSRGAR